MLVNWKSRQVAILSKHNNMTIISMIKKIVIRECVLKECSTCPHACSSQSMKSNFIVASQPAHANCALNHYQNNHNTIQSTNQA